jgi:8-oxo-dGTP pyrophosphatase MutT (NUDIX family)
MPHIHDKIDFTVEVLILYKNKVLLRMHDKYKIWLGVGGHVELDEDPNQAALREVREEVGLNVKLVRPKDFVVTETSAYKELIPPMFMNRNRINDNHEHITLWYFATTDSNKIIQGDSEISDSCRWFSLEELDDPKYQIRESLVHYAKTALGTIRPGM